MFERAVALFHAVGAPGVRRTRQVARRSKQAGSALAVAEHPVAVAGDALLRTVLVAGDGVETYAGSPTHHRSTISLRWSLSIKTILQRLIYVQY